MNGITLSLPLEGFVQDSISTIEEILTTSKIIIEGHLVDRGNHTCPKCGHKMYIHGSYRTTFKHASLSLSRIEISLLRNRYCCPECIHSEMEEIPFQAGNHRLTSLLYTWTCILLEYGLTNKMVSWLTGLCRNTVKDIDKERLEGKYTFLDKDGIRRLKKPERPSRYLGIDEFKLHNGYKYATVIIDLEDGRVLWLSRGKKKQCVHDFIDYVGEKWMKNVKAVACDMNSDFSEVFKERCKHIKVVFDYFHIKKNFNDKVISEVRKDEQKRLLSEGRVEEAKALKGSKYILTSSRETLRAKDKEAREYETHKNKVSIFRGGGHKKPVGGQVETYEKIIKDNVLLFTADYIKEQLSKAYSLDNEDEMCEEIAKIIETCRATDNKHFIWFAKLLENHADGIISHAHYKLSSGKVEGVNNLIKTLRRMSYGLPDDDYFFLKIFDASRRKYNGRIKKPTN